MRDGAYIKRLSADVERWRASGAVSADQASALLEDARTRADISKSSPAAIAAALGAVLFGLGLITFIAANWGAMPKSARMLAALVLIWITFGGVIVALERKANWIGQTFALAGALAIGAAVSLIGQTYNVEGDAAGLMLVWSLGALATAIAFRSTPVLILYVILAFIWFVTTRPAYDFFGAIFGGGLRIWDLRYLGLAYAPLWFAGAFLGRRVDSGAAMHLSGLNALTWLALFFADGIWARHTQWLSAGLMLTGASFALGALAEWMRARHGERAAQIALAWSAAGVFCGLLIAEFNLWDKHNRVAEMTFAAATLALATWAMSWGETPGRRAVRAFAVALFAFECFYIYAALFEGLLDTSLFLLGGGALLFGLAFGLRYLTRKKPAEAQP